MRARGRLVLLLSFGALYGCQLATLITPGKPARPAAPPPTACQLAEFGAAPGTELVRPKRAAKASKAGPASDAIPLNRSIAGTGAWVDAGPGWRAWRYWLRFETARSVAVHMEPFALPDHAELWLCSPDRTTRQGPITGKGLGGGGQYRSPDVPGPELWIEVLAPRGTETNVELVLTEAFAAAP
jgi:hypothetical protein